MAPEFFELAIVVLIAAALGVVAKLLRQPIILAYLATGLVVGVAGFLHRGDAATFHVFANLGIMFLLFLVGLEINYTSLRLVGKSVLKLGIAQILFTSFVGLLLSRAFGFSFIHAAYIGIALTFSSTIIVVKLLSEKKDIHNLYGRLSLGLLLVQDFVAILLLVFLAGTEGGNGVNVIKIIATLVEGILLFGVMLYLGKNILPKLFDRIARSQELLFLTSLAWVFLIASLVSKLGFSVEIGGFLAGVALANASENFEIASRIRPLRDFFILLFFVILGSSVVISNIGSLALPILALSLFVLIGNPFIVLIIMGFIGYRRRTSFLTGVTVAQISEFSLVLVALGFRLGHLDERVVGLITAVGVVTIVTSSYLITHADKIFKLLSPYLRVFERKRTREEVPSMGKFEKQFVLVGAHRTGQVIAHNIPKEKLLVIDHDPAVIAHLRAHRFDYLFGDVIDTEIMEKANIAGARVLISTVPDVEDNLTLLSEVAVLRAAHAAPETRPPVSGVLSLNAQQRTKISAVQKVKPQKPSGVLRLKVIVRAESEDDAKLLYERGADYVLLPHFTAGQYLAKTIGVDPEMKILEHLKQKDLEMLRNEKIT